MHHQLEHQAVWDAPSTTIGPSSNRKTPLWQLLIGFAIVTGAIAGVVFATRNSNAAASGKRRKGWSGSTCQAPSATASLPLEIIPPSSNDNNDSIFTAIGAQSAADEIIILQGDEKLLSNQGVSSPNGQYCLEITNDGALVLSMKITTNETVAVGSNSTNSTNTRQNQTIMTKTTTIIKTTTTILWQHQHQRGSNNTDGENGATLSMQVDGNLVFRAPEPNNSVIWSSTTIKESGASLRLNDNGRLAVISRDGRTPLWMHGIPAGAHYNESGRQRQSLTLPVRGIFYYPWFPETWSVDGNPVFYQPTEGKYSNGNQTLIRRHVEALQYAHIDLSIASWWGPGRKKDRARITNLMDESVMANSRVKWSVYHEEERRLLPNVTELQIDLAYLKKWFVWHDGWAFINGKPVIFVYNSNGCDVSRRWVEAANCEWYVVLKVFGGFEKCDFQPEGWHQYGPSSGAIHTEGFAYSIAPGFWAADEEGPRLSRLSNDTFRADAQAMVDSGEPLQLIATFNEWGEGTSVESAAEWASPSGYGVYMDALHEVW